MEEQREILEQLKKTLQMLTVEPSKNNQIANEEKEKKENENSWCILEHNYEDIAQEFIDFIYKNPTTYHVVSFFAELLDKHNFKYLSEKSNWQDSIGEDGGKFYTIRNGTNLSAFILGKNWRAEKGVGVIGSHVDALTVKLKPVSLKDTAEGYGRIAVAPYGGTLNELWLDRDLGIGGRLLYKKKGTNEIKSALVDSTPLPVCRIPSLAPHFGKPAEGPFDKEDQTIPVIGFPTPDEEGNEPPTDDEKKSPLFGKHCIHLLRYVAKLAGVEVSELIQMDLDLFDVQKGTIGGIGKHFLFAPRLDDRLCSFAAMIALICYAKDVNTEESDLFSTVTLYDNEEIGSLTRQGAKGGLLESVVERSSSAFTKKPVDLHTVWANSIILSADVNHLYNPNFPEVYLKNHFPVPNVGITLSLDPNGHMATDVVGTALVEELARRNGDKVQYFQIKNNSRSGGTIGPSLASQTGARTIDLGIAQLSMHSIRAATGSKDVGLGVKFFNGFFKHWRSVYDEFGEL
ncbi:Lap4p [Saccharomyces cerevisiae YJM326]|nr:Lap4p [Saccharomyces cerevisiae YJM326]AJS34880.1 Lap4p [Saccharomyces cerevisiae YJM554]AJS36079.1 Lap4p [Saccharomyces cerevisiae YJM682]AJS36380.1 Lap4p [Saccharomyces cerevisiae YJM683]AJS39974.1 Lap4p [Saccharomyces cerevisiae YJM1083]AJS43864.1 Lap4p [Saccharomyces cerevisiae YJM1304]AJS56961.1 Lap4p [Saccharomyces cerevisiae YJM1615]CAI4595796.1 ABA_G0032990.mRNA.1.CDS.1 [Saccharomyces cerevisiae]